MADDRYFETCKFCGETDQYTTCGATHPNNGYGCTRAPGHEGPHIACAFDHDVARWTGKADADKPRATRSDAAAELRAELLAGFHAADDRINVTAWAKARGIEESSVRGAIGGLRREGHDIVSVGSGNFQLQAGESS